MGDQDETRQLRRDELAFRQWEADRDLRLKAINAALSLSEQERSLAGGVVGAAGEIEKWIRHG